LHAPRSTLRRPPAPPPLPYTPLFRSLGARAHPPHRKEGEEPARRGGGAGHECRTVPAHRDVDAAGGVEPERAFPPSSRGGTERGAPPQLCGVVEPPEPLPVGRDPRSGSGPVRRRDDAPGA